VNALANTVEGLLLNPERLRALGEAGRKSALRDFSAGRMAENIARVFQQVSSRPPARNVTEGTIEIANHKS
jgi:glycosyltransferase involved in cell wall biosynthesis